VLFEISEEALNLSNNFIQKRRTALSILT